jgi:general secretion pathway protein E
MRSQILDFMALPRGLEPPCCGLEMATGADALTRQATASRSAPKVVPGSAQWVADSEAGRVRVSFCEGKSHNGSPMSEVTRSPRASFLDWLVQQGRLSGVLAERVSRVQLETSDRLASVILKLGLLSEEALASDLIGYTGLPRLGADELPSAAVAIPDFNVEFVRSSEIVPTQCSAESIDVVAWDALDDVALRSLEFSFGRPVRRSIGTRAEVRRLIDSLYPREDGEDDTPDAATRDEDEEVDRLKDLASDAPVIRLVQQLVNDAIAARASDIHLEPSERALHVRLRLDGLLREVESQPREVAAAVISRIKVMAALNIAERRLPQDGRIRVTVQGKDVDFRVATTPTLHGESVVLRILDRQDVALDFNALGFDEELQSSLRSAIERPFGIVLVTGPTGSGKTTTLYAALKEINTPERKIITVEDPVEYVLEGVNQVPVRPQIGLTFAQALRAFLRQDPDVLMVGEIRDRETAEIAIQAALTGHLLLSTLHTNTAAAAVTRLLDMGIDDYLLTSTLHVVLGQRLVRKLCPECREPYAAAADVCRRFGLTPDTDRIWYRARGCARCGGTGFRGRTSIIEALPMTDAVRARILSRGDAQSLEKIAIGEGMRTMLHHGIERVSAGVTTAEEVLRVTSLN